MLAQVGGKDGAPSEHKPRMRAPVQLPPGLALQQEESAFAALEGTPTLRITRRWLRGKHYVLLVVFWGLAAALAYYVSGHGWSWVTGFAAVVLTSWHYQLLTMFLNRTVIVAGGGRLKVDHRPLPALGLFPRIDLEVGQLKQLYAVKHGQNYAVKGELTDGNSTMVVAPLVTPEQALFIEQQLEHALGVVDFEVDGELARSMPTQLANASGPKTGKAALGLLALAPVAVGAGIVGLVLTIIETEVSGALSVQRGQERFEFVPVDCSSGQPYGFFGVDVQDAAGQVVRLINDPVRGPVVMIKPTGRETQPLSLADCDAAEVDIVTTNTTINDVRALDGSVRLACPGIVANMTFGNCH